MRSGPMSWYFRSCDCVRPPKRGHAACQLSADHRRSPRTCAESRSASPQRSPPFFLPSSPNCLVPQLSRAPYALTDLGTLGGLSAQAYDINDAGQVVGYSTTATSQSHGFLWQNGTMTDLGTIGGTKSDAHAINGFGQIAGRSTVAANSVFHAVLWDGSVKTDLTPASTGGA